MVLFFFKMADIYPLKSVSFKIVLSKYMQQLAVPWAHRSWGSFSICIALDTYAGFRLACRSSHCCFIAWSLLAVSELQLSAGTPLWLFHRATSLLSWIEVNCLRSTALGKVVRLSIGWLDTTHLLFFPLRLRSCKKITINAASGKLVWKQH